MSQNWVHLPQIFGVNIQKKMKPVHRALVWVFPKIGVKPPKWMVKIMENPYEQMDDLRGFTHYFRKHPYM